ncbi:hypothetical protein M8C21_023252, partial [Ambrosia artemisiifolia]
MADLAIYGGGEGFLDSCGQDMLVFEDYSFSDLLQQHSVTPDVVHIPTTNSSSISSSSNEPENVNDFDQDKNHVKSDDDQQNTTTTTNKQLKAKKKNPKKQREPRFAFMTKTEVDHLDDGYRWRKYGQKAVKNSPFPRSYYRCTSASCRVKKMIERSSEDPWMVVTTYEGTHTHPCPMNPRSILSKTATYGGRSGSNDVDISSFLSSQLHYQQPPPQPFFSNQTNHFSFNNTTTTSISSVVQSLDSHYYQERQDYPSSLASSSFIRDDGLLQDMLSFQVSKEEPKESL